MAAKPKKQYFAIDLPDGGGYSNLYGSLEDLVDNESAEDGSEIYILEIVAEKDLKNKPSLV